MICAECSGSDSQVLHLREAHQLPRRLDCECGTTVLAHSLQAVVRFRWLHALCGLSAPTPPRPGGPALQASRSQDAALRTACAGRGTYEINGRPEAEGRSSTG